MRLPVVLHRPHSERITLGLQALDFRSMALFALAAATRRHACLEASAGGAFNERLQTARAHLDLLEATLMGDTVDRSAALWSLPPSAFETDRTRASIADATARLHEMLFLLRDAIEDEAGDLVLAIPALALECIYAQIRCVPGDCSAQSAEICAAHAEAVREERAQLDDLERIAPYAGERDVLVSELTDRARSWPLVRATTVLDCVPNVCSAL